MKKALSAILALTLLFLLCACGSNTQDTEPSKPSESTQSATTTESSTENTTAPIDNVVTTAPSEEVNEVPESVVLRNISIDENATYSITHNYDSASHIDDVELITCYNGEYGTRTTTYTYAYQYDKSSDLWSLIGGNNGMVSDVITLSEESYKNNNYFSGDFNQVHNGTYSIMVESLDLANNKATVTYAITFDDDMSTLYSTETFELDTANDGKSLCFVIPYTRSMVVRFELIFVLDMDVGLRAISY